MLFASLLAAHAAAVSVFNQVLDHFGAQSGRFSQRYILENGYLDENSPIVIQIGEFGRLDEVDPFYPTTRAIANVTKSKMLIVENRYFGESVPENDEKMKYLSVSQMIEDILCIVNEIAPKSRHRLVIGGRYSGTVALYLRMKYPQHIDSAWVSMAPVKIQTFYSDYDYNLIRKLHKINDACFGKLQDVMILLNKTITSNENPDLRKEYLKYFGFNENVDDSFGLYLIAENLGLMFDIEQNTGYIKQLCNEKSITPQVYGNYFKKTLDYYRLNVNDLNPFLLNNIPLNDNQKNEKAFWKLKCSYFGGFHSSPLSGTKHYIFFRTPLVNKAFYQKICNYLFEKKSLGDFSKLNYNLDYDKLQINKILFTIDPNDSYSSLMLTNSNNRNFDIEYLNNTSYLQDLIPLSSENKLISDIRSKLIKRFANIINQPKCLNGEYLNGRCICNKEYTGEFCDIKGKYSKTLKNVATFLTLIPTLIIISASFIFWKTIYVQETKNVVSSLF